MGLFDFLTKKSSPPPPPGKGGAKGEPGKSTSKKLAGPAKTCADKRAQTYDRAEAIRVLSEARTPEAAEALLKRFLFTIDPSITDQEEKEAAFAGVVACGEEAVPHVIAMCGRSEVLTWPIRILREVLSVEDFKKELVTLANGYETEYSRNVEPKIQVIGALGDVKADDARVAIERFLEDANENVRFTAVQSTFAQGNKASIPALTRVLETEESIRIRNKVCGGFVSQGWRVAEDSLEKLKKPMRDLEDYALQSDGSFKQQAGFSIMT